MKTFFAKLLLAIGAFFGYLSGFAAHAERQQRQADKLQEHYDELANDGRSASDAYSRLRMRNDKGSGRLP